MVSKCPQLFIELNRVFFCLMLMIIYSLITTVFIVTIIFIRFCSLLQVVGINFICHVLYHVSILNRGIALRIIHLINLPDVSLCPTNFPVLFLLDILTASLIPRFGRIGNAAFLLIKSVVFLELSMLSISCLLKLYYLFDISNACGEGLSRLGTI